MSKVIIAGSRGIEDWPKVHAILEKCQFSIDEVVSGGAAGVDHIGEDWAREKCIPYKVFTANWALHHKAAGPIRNLEMAKYADCLIAIWDGKSPGTKNMIETMSKLGKPVQVENI